MMLFLHRSAALVGFASLSFTARASAQSVSGTLSGHMRGVGGGVEPGATVRVLGTRYVASVDSAGRYTIARLPVGRQIIRVRKMGFTPDTATANGDTYFYAHSQIDASPSYSFTRSAQIQFQALNPNNAVFGFCNGTPDHDCSVQREYYGRTFYLGAKYDL